MQEHRLAHKKKLSDKTEGGLLIFKYQIFQTKIYCNRPWNKFVFIIITIIIDCKCRNCPSARSTSATNAIGGDFDTFNGRSFSANDRLESDTFTR